MLAGAAVLVDAVVAKSTQARRIVRRIGGDYATFPRRNVLDRVEAEGREAAVAARRTAAPRGAQGVARVDDEIKTAVFGELSKQVVVARLAGVVDAHHRFRPSARSTLSRFHVEQQCFRVNIGENWARTDIH